MTGQPEILVLRPILWRQVGGWLVALIIAGTWVPEILSPSLGHLAAGIVGLAAIGGVLVYVLARIRLVVTPDAVAVRDVPRQRGGTISRTDVQSVHICSASVRLQAHGKVLLKIAPYWSEKQLTALAAELHVPLYTHKRLLGLADSKHGTVLYRPPEGLPRQQLQ